MAAVPVEGNNESRALVTVEPEPGGPGPQLSYAGAGTLALEQRQCAALIEQFQDDAYEVKPTGEVYVSQIHYRRRLNAVFGPGSWALVPRSGWINQGDTVCREYALYVRGVFVAEAIGETDYQPSNDRMSYASAAEGARSSALTRCCKDLGIASECWSRRWANAWREGNCVQVWRRNGGKPQWRLKDAQPFHDETGPVRDRPAGGQASESRAEHAPPSSAPLAMCPNCGKAGRVSKFSKPGGTHYCSTCKVTGATGKEAALTFEPLVTREPGDDDEPAGKDAPAEIAHEIVEGARILGLTPAQASAVLVSLGYRTSKDVPAGKLGAVMDALHAAAKGAPAGEDSAQDTDVPVVEGKPECSCDQRGRCVICRASGEWVCSGSKGGCGRVLGRQA